MTEATRGRLAGVLGVPALARLRARLRGRLERGAPLTGRLTLPSPSDEERAAVEGLFGRLSRGQALHVDLDELSGILRAAELGDDLEVAILALEGPIENRRERAIATAARWQEVVLEAQAIGAGTCWRAGLDEVDQTGLVRRLAAGDPEEGAVLLAGALAVLRRLPASAVPLAELAAAALGDSHGLDLGEPVATLVLRVVAVARGQAPPADADQRRAAWAAVGVLADELSAPALVLNLRAAGTEPTGRALVLAADAGEPYRLSTRQLLRQPPRFELVPGSPVFVCENPSVVAAAADRLGTRAHPLLCTEGQPKTALRLALAQLREAGAAIRYHGDFDWAGIQIANGMVERFAAVPWRFRAADYLEAEARTRAGAALSGIPALPVWEAALGAAMQARGRAVHEESVVDDLLADLEEPSCRR